MVAVKATPLKIIKEELYNKEEEIERVSSFTEYPHQDIHSNINDHIEEQNNKKSTPNPFNFPQMATLAD